MTSLVKIKNASQPGYPKVLCVEVQDLVTRNNGEGDEWRTGMIYSVASDAESEVIYVHSHRRLIVTEVQ